MFAIIVIQNEFSKRIEKNPRYSLRSFAKYLEMPPGRLSEILSGKRALTYNLGKKIVKKIDIDPEKKYHFLSSITSLKKSKKNISKSNIDNDFNYTELSNDSYYLISDWYHFAILSLMETKNFKSNNKWISARLGISIVVVKIALERLQRLGFVGIKNKKYILKTGNLTTTDDIESSALRKSHKQSLENVIDIIDSVDMKHRSITSTTMAINKKNIPLAKKIIKKFRRELAQLLETGDRDEVYEINVQLIPVTKINKCEK